MAYCASLEQLHGFVSGDRGDLLIAGTGLDQTGDGLVTQVVKAEPLYDQLVQCAVPGRAGFIGSALAVVAGFTP